MSRRGTSLYGAWVALVALALGACAAPAPKPVTNAGRYSMHKDVAPEVHEIPDDVASRPDAVPRREPRSASGNSPVYEVFGKSYRVLASADGFRERGYASWYGKKFHGHRTASGERYDMFEMTAAHKSLPLPSYVRVTRLDTGRSVVVRVNDRGPFHQGRVIDLSYAAAAKLDMLGSGSTEVEVTALLPDADAPVQTVHIVPSDRWLQIGTFADPINAVIAREDLQTRGFGDAQILVADEDGAAIHRVVLGPFANADRAHQMLTRLQRQGYQPIWLRQ